MDKTITLTKTFASQEAYDAFIVFLDANQAGFGDDWLKTEEIKAAEIDSVEEKKAA